MNEEQLEQAKARMQEALKQTQEQTEDAAVQITGFLRKGMDKLREAADAAADAIRNDINSRP